MLIIEDTGYLLCFRSRFNRIPLAALSVAYWAKEPLTCSNAEQLYEVFDSAQRLLHFISGSDVGVMEV